MKKKGILLAVVVLFGAVGLVQAQVGELEELGATVDVSYLSSYIWRGFDMYPGAHGEGAIQTSVGFEDILGTGFGVKVLSSRANTDGFEEDEELRLTLSYGNTLGVGEAFATKVNVGWVYYNHPDAPKSGRPASRSNRTNPAGRGADWQEVFASLSWPELCPEAVVPSYTLVRMWPSESGTPRNATGNASAVSGWLHLFGLDYDWVVSGFLADIPEQTVHFSATAVYNEGVSPAYKSGVQAGGADHDWSHAVFGVSTDLEFTKEFAFTPGVYYQWSWDDSVNDQDEVWVGLSLKYQF